MVSGSSDMACSTIIPAPGNTRIPGILWNKKEKIPPENQKL
jgi:hypothetical protein